MLDVLAAYEVKVFKDVNGNTCLLFTIAGTLYSYTKEHGVAPMKIYEGKLVIDDELMEHQEEEGIDLWIDVFFDQIVAELKKINIYI